MLWHYFARYNMSFSLQTLWLSCCKNQLLINNNINYGFFIPSRSLVHTAPLQSCFKATDYKQQRCNRRKSSENKGIKQKKRTVKRRETADMSERVCSRRVKHCREAEGGCVFSISTHHIEAVREEGIKTGFYLERILPQRRACKLRERTEFGLEKDEDTKEKITGEGTWRSKERSMRNENTDGWLNWKSQWLNHLLFFFKSVNV